MGGKCSPSGGIKTQNGRIGSLPIKSESPNSRMDLFNGGNRTQSNWYNANGFVIWSRDYEHANPYNNHDFPHDHEWKFDPEKNRSERISKNLPVNPNYCG